jgi:hypothetical protein
MVICRPLIEKGSEPLRLEPVRKLVWSGSFMEDSAMA